MATEELVLVYLSHMPRNRKAQQQAMKADPTLRDFVDGLRAVLDKGPLHEGARPLDIERFYVGPADPVPRSSRHPGAY